MTFGLTSRPVWLIGVVIALLGAAFLALSTTGVASAHPLGNFTVNRYSRIEVYSDKLRVNYVLDMAEIPTFQDAANVDTNGDGTVTDAEAQAYAASKAAELQKNLGLQLNGASQDLRLTESHVSFPEGQGGLQTTRLTATYETSPPAGLVALTYVDANFADRLGWREIVVLPTTGAQLTGKFSTRDVSQALTSYPGDKIASPLDTTSVQFSLDAASAVTAPALSDIPVEAAAPERSGTAFVSLINTSNITLQVILLALLAAFGFGALHAVEPGHGKTMVAAYFVGVKGTAQQALALGLIVAFTHTIGVLAIGLVAIFGSQWILPERIYPWLSLASGLMVLALGLRLIAQRSGGRIMRRLSHLPIFGHHHRSHDHAPVTATADGIPPWKSLIAIGLADGLTPSPSALVVLIAAVSLHRIGLGIALIVAFSAGLATVLASISLGLLVFRRAMDRFSHRIASGRVPLLSRVVPSLTSEGVVVRALPMAGALALVAVGLLLTLRALGQPVAISL
jgi:ABC-type nickel/cobalt efflux system permease component RcnA